MERSVEGQSRGVKSACGLSSGHFDKRLRSYFFEQRPVGAKGIDQSLMEPKTGSGWC